jgi:hypothetical protein
MKFEQELKRSLSDAPPLPPDLFRGIEQKVNFKHKWTVFYYSVAATVILFLVSLSAVQHKPVYTVEAEAAEELQTLHDFVNGNDLDNDIEMYAIINNY